MSHENDKERLTALTRQGDLVAATELARIAAHTGEWQLLKLAADVLVGDAVWVVHSEGELTEGRRLRLSEFLEGLASGKHAGVWLSNAQLYLVPRPVRPTAGETMNINHVMGWMNDGAGGAMTEVFGTIRSCSTCCVLFVAEESGPEELCHSCHDAHREDAGTAYIPGLGTVRSCLDCGGLIAGGPTRCVHCVRRGKLNTAKADMMAKFNAEMAELEDEDNDNG